MSSVLRGSSFVQPCGLIQRFSGNQEFALPARINLKSSAHKALAALGLLFALTVSALTQQAVVPVGITQGSTRITAGPVNIDMATGNMIVDIPVRNKMGAFPFGFDLVYNLGNQGFPNSYLEFLSSMSSGGATGLGESSLNICGGGPSAEWWKFYVSDGTGSQHLFPPDPLSVGPSPCGPTSLTVVTTDGSGFTGVLNGDPTFTYTIYNKDGIGYSWNGGTPTWTDRDGNKITQTLATPNVYTDTLGQTAMTATLGGNLDTGGHSGTPDQYSYVDGNGVTQYYTVAYAAQEVLTVFGCAPPYGDNTSPVTWYLPSSLTTPAGTYSFTYEPTGSQYGSDITGRLQRVTLPTGGYVSFAYTGGTAGYNCTSRVIPTLAVTINDNNGNSNTTTYVNGNNINYEDPCCGNFNVTVTSNPDPDNGNNSNVTVNSFNGEWLTQSVDYEGPATGTPLSIMQTCYNGNTTTCATPPGAVGGTLGNFITQKNIYTLYNSTSLAGAKEEVTTYDCYTISPCYGNVTSVAEYDFGQILLSTTNYTYSGCGAGTYIVDRPCSVTVLGPTNSQVSQTLYTYNASGHPIQTQRWVGGTTFLTSSATYASNGALTSSTDVNSAITSYTNGPGVGACNGLLSQGTTYPTVNSVTLSTSQTWNCSGGVMATFTDENSNVTTFSYADPLWRQTQVTYPDGGETKTTYNDTASPPNVQGNRLIDSASHWLTTQTNLDGIGRPIQKLLTSDPNGTVNAVTTYDVLGRVASVTNPYYTTGDPTYGVTQYAYDALGRTTSVTDADGSQRLMSYSGAWSESQDEGNGTKPVMRIYQHDGLGRLVTVCEVSSTTLQGGSPTSCGAFSANGYLTTYAYSALGNLVSVTQGAQTRTFNYDGLSRLTSESHPEASAATTYTYDATTPTNQKGDLYQRLAPLPNQTGSACPNVLTECETTTYTHDALHRLVSKAYSDGTPTADYYYDQSSPWGTTLTNYLGRLTTEGTYNGSWITSAEFSYDQMGRALLNAQAVPTQYNLNYTYNNLGDWTSSTNGMGTTLTYAYNQAAELTSLTSSLSDANHPSTLFSLGSLEKYNALGSLSGDSLGNGGETLTYDKRGRLSTVATLGPDQGTNTPGKGIVSVSGTEQVITTTAVGSVTISGTEKGESVGCPKACSTVWDTGTVTITAGGVAEQVTFENGSNYTNIAAALATAINGDSHAVVTASQSSGTVNLTSKLSGSGGNYSLSASVTSILGSFTTAPSGATLTGGSSTYDTGTVSVTVGGVEETVSYGQSDTPTTIASNLAAKFNSDPSSLASGSASGGTLNLTSKATGSGSNYTLAASETWNSSKFSHASFTTSPSGADLTGGTNGQGTIYNLALGYTPNSNIASANDTVNGNWTYTYDDFNRLLTSTNSVGTLTEVYDRYGNRWQQNATGSGGWPQPQYSFNGSNQIVGDSYDAAGNLTYDGTHHYFYDGENRLIQVDGTQGTCSSATACYIYDAEGQRAGKTLGASTVYYLYDLAGKQIAEVSSGGTWNRGEVYAGSRHLATYSGGSTGVTYFTTADWLGTERMRTGLTSIVETCTSLPFGDGLNCTGSDVNPMHFTGKQRDPESGDDHFGARYYGSTTGRFMQTDPVTATPVHIINPQRWNMYAYGMNNPLSYIDPDGRDVIAVNFTKEVPLGGHEGIISVQADGSAQYARFGPLHSSSPGDQGKVDVQPLSSVRFRSDGLPTDASYKQIASQVAKIEGQDPSTIRMNYFKTSGSDTDALNVWIARIKAASDAGKAPDYDVSSQNCATFCRIGLVQARAIHNIKLSNIPNVLFNQLSLLALESYANGQRSKEVVTHKICDDQGKNCQ
jgi:RHS repeat-associated protein